MTLFDIGVDMEKKDTSHKHIVKIPYIRFHPRQRNGMLNTSCRPWRYQQWRIWYFNSFSSLRIDRQQHVRWVSWRTKKYLDLQLLQESFGFHGSTPEKTNVLCWSGHISIIWTLTKGLQNVNFIMSNTLQGTNISHLWKRLEKEHHR